MKCLTVSVDYWDVLAVTLPRNLVHFDIVLVVTSPEDDRTASLARAARADVLRTNAFYRRGAIFNKGASIEEGFDRLGRTGWFCVLDADTLLPSQFAWPALEVGCLYSPYRRMTPLTAKPPAESEWPSLPPGPERRNGEYAGYCQVFHADDPVLCQRPWYPTDWRHAGGCDTDFHLKWSPQKKRRLSFEVLHLGPVGRNWCGRQTPYLDGTAHLSAARRSEAMRRMAADRKKYGYLREKMQ